MRAKPWDVSDGLWERLEPLLPRRQRRFRYPGRKPLDDRRVLQGILFVLHTGIGWEHLPQELGFGCGMRPGVGCATGRRRVCGSVCTRRCWPSCTRPARSTGRARSPTPVTCKRKRGLQTGPSPVDRGRRGSKQHLLVDGGGVPLAWTLTGGNRNDITQLLALLDRVPHVRGRTGRPRHRPDSVVADRGYDHDKYRRLVWQRGIKPVIARRQTQHGSGLGRERWVVERTFAWLHNRRRLLVRTDRRHQTHEGFLDLACCLITWRRVETSLK